MTLNLLRVVEVDSGKFPENSVLRYLVNAWHC